MERVNIRKKLLIAFTIIIFINYQVSILFFKELCGTASCQSFCFGYIETKNLRRLKKYWQHNSESKLRIDIIRNTYSKNALYVKDVDTRT